MSTSFPSGLDSLTNPTANDTVENVSHSDQHANANDAIEALEAKVGVDGSAVTTSHDYKLSTITGANKAASQAGVETLTNKTLTSPKIGTSVDDVNGNEIIETPATASAVNHIGVTNAATATAPTIEAKGSDTNVDLNVKGKGTGSVKLGTAGLKFPNSDGTASQVVTTDGAGQLSFSSAVTPTVGTASTTTLSVTTSGTQTIMVWAKGTGTGTGGPKNIELKYNGVTKDIHTGTSGTGGEDSFALMYSEIPAAGTQDITVTTSAATLTNVKITYLLIG